MYFAAFLLLIIIMAGSRAALAAASELIAFRANGTVVGFSLSNGSTNFAITNEFTLAVSLPKYWLEVRGKRSPSDKALMQDLYYDGVDLYCLVRHNVGASETNVQNTATMSIYEGPVPQRIDPHACAVWLAYLSRYALLGPAGQVKAPALLDIPPAYEEHGIKVDLIWQCSRRRPEALAWARELHPGKTYSLDGNRLIERPLPQPLSLGYTNWTYEVLEWAECSGYTLPRRSTLVSYGLSHRNQSELCQYFVANIYLGSADTNIEAVSMDPQFPARTRISDRRVRITGMKHVFTYLSKSGAILSRKEMEAMRDFRLNQTRDATEAKMPSRRKVFVVLLAMIALTPAFITLVMYRLKRKPQP